MSKRSDFAQKLLDDLRLRKERLAASHGSNSSKLLAGGDAYANSKKRHSGGSATLKTSDKTSFRTVTGVTRSGSIVKEEASMQIVPFRRGQHSQLIGDILNSSVLSFMNQITRRSVELGTRQRKTSNRRDLSLTSHFPVLSQLHITEVSKGAEKLNRILKAYSSNGFYFDNHSIEIGKELLKGAIDLKESLQMLVRLEEAEKYMITPHTKNQIMLLEVEDQDNDIDNHKKPSRNRHSHSASYVSDVPTLSAHSRQTNYSSSIYKTEKRIIPNVIAKLMGLDELPENDESKYTEKNTSIPEQRREGIIAIEMSQSGKYLDQCSTSVKQKQINGSQLTQFQESLLAYKNKKAPAIHQAGFEVTLENVNAERGSYKAEVRKDNRQRSINQPSNISNRQKEMHENDNGLNNSKFGPQKSVKKNEEKEPVLKHELQKMAPHTHKRSKTNLSSHKKMGFKETTPMVEVTDAVKIWANSQEGETKNQRIEKLKKSRLNLKKIIPTMHTDMNLQKQHPHPKKATHNRKGFIESIDKMQSERCERGRPNEDQVRERNSMKYSNDKRGFVNRNSISDESTSYINLDFKNKKTSNQQVMEVKAVRASNNEKVNVPKMDEHEMHRMVEKVTTGRNASLHNVERPVEHQTSILLNVKQGRHDKFIGVKEAIQMSISKSKKAGATIGKLNNSVPILKPTTVQENLTIQENQASLLHSPMEDECPNQMELQVDASYESDQKKTLMLTNDRNDHTVSFRSNEAYKRTSDAFNGTRAHEQGNFQHQKHLKSAKLAQLTENETYLKQTLVRSQLFLDTAEALFRLTIPHGTFHGCGFNHHDNDIKLIIDCGYEVMKRKGKRQELYASFCLTMSMSFVTVTTLDELVKELYMDLEKMKLYGCAWNKECGTEDCLKEVIAIDVMNSDPDTNCMWDSGWNGVIFAFRGKDDIVKEIEKYVINGLLDEMIRDLLP